jgi:pyruvate,orthophosphate dikinase
MVAIVKLGLGTSAAASAEEIGAKAANLDQVARLGIPVPPAFVLPIDLCAAIVSGDAGAEAAMRRALAEGIVYLESALGRRFGDRRQPLLVSVRSGAARSMPGMLETVLDVGASGEAVHGLIRMTGNPRFAYDCARRLTESYATTACGLAAKVLDDALDRIKHSENVTAERDLDGEALGRLVTAYHDALAEADLVLPDDPMEQLVGAARAVYRSWMSARARTYRTIEKLEHLRGTAVLVQAMVYGNRNLRSGAGVVFSRDPSSGPRSPVIEMVFGAQGEDVVSGRRTPESEATIKAVLPDLLPELGDVLTRLERAFKDIQDVEFTIEDSRLWILQTRAAKRTPRAALRFAIDLVSEGLISKDEAVKRLDGLDLDLLTRTRFAEPGEPTASGIAASNGVAVGRAAFSAEAAARLAADGNSVILLRPETSTADIAGFAAATGIVTAIGGRTAHAALVARQMGKPCIVGCATLAIAPDEQHATIADAALTEGDWLSVDGDSGAIYLGKRTVVSERPQAEIDQVKRWRSAGLTTTIV